MKLTLLPWLLISICLLASITHATHTAYFDELIKSPKSDNPPNGDAWPDFEVDSEYIPVYIGPQDGLMEANKIDALPGQPEGVNFDQYSGYVTVDPKAGRALFYYFVESPENSSINPLVLWLNGGPGCSSLIGAMQELGPFRVNSDGKTLYRNPFAWNNVANVLFLESPAGVGYSYSNTTSDYDNCGDKNTAKDAYVFLVNWLERFPQYKTRDFFITGESYAGHYIPQLSYTILLNNEITNQTVINLQGVAMGNALINEYDNSVGQYDYFWTHALISDETHLAVHKHCLPDFSNKKCEDAEGKMDTEMGELDIYNIYASLCTPDGKINNHTKGSVQRFDPCTLDFVHDYLNLAEVQKAFHANPTTWLSCSWPGKITWNDRPNSVIPTIKQMMKSNITIWLYSGDMDGRVPVTSTRYSINSMNIPIKTSWYPWYTYHHHPHQQPTYTNEEVGGYAVEYEGLVFATVRGAGHLVPSYQPERALILIKAFIGGKLPPARFVR